MAELPLTALRAFAAVHETGGVRAAARRLGTSHSAISHHCRELESWLGIRLFESVRGARPTLTAKARAFGTMLNRSFSNIEQAVESLREMRRPKAGTIATTASVATRWLLPRLSRLQQQASWIEVSVIVDTALRDPGEQGADLALRMGAGPWADLNCEPLMDDALFPALSAERWREAGRPTDLAALKRMPLLHDRDPNTSWALWRAQFGPKALDVRRGPRFSSSDLVLRAAAQGLGAALARGRLAQGDLDLGLLVRPFGELSIDLPNAYWIVRPPLQPDRSALLHVVEWLKQEAGPLRPIVQPAD